MAVNIKPDTNIFFFQNKEHCDQNCTGMETTQNIAKRELRNKKKKRKKRLPKRKKTKHTAINQFELQKHVIYLNNLNNTD